MGEILFDTNTLIELAKSDQKNVEGYTTIFNVIEFPKTFGLFGKITIIFPSSQDYELALELSTKLYKIGKAIPAMDILVGTICYNNKLILISKDKHFDTVKEVWNDFHISQDYNIKNKKEK